MSTATIPGSGVSPRLKGPSFHLANPVLPFVAPATLYRMSVDEYDRMTQSGILGEDNPIELLEGILVEKTPRNNPHDHSIRLLTPRLIRLIPAGWTVQCQCAVTFDTSKPEPDFAILRGDESKFSAAQPRASDAALLIEVADTSLDRDRIDKGRIYARAGVPVYWVVNAIDGEVDVFTDPVSPETVDPFYQTRTTYTREQSIPLILDGQTVGTIPVGEMF